MEKELLGLLEAALKLGVHTSTVYRWAKSGELPGFQVSAAKLWRFKAEDVEALRKRREAQGL